jgi:DNA adenine methylase
MTDRPALRYMGSKSLLGKWVISHFAKHDFYFEGFGGGANVLIQKPRVLVETYNDLDSRVVNFFKVLRSRPDDLIHLLTLTPYAREEFEDSLTGDEDSLEDARKLFVSLWMSIGGRQNQSGSWRYIKTARKGSKSPAGYWTLDHLYTIADRLMGVQIENGDAFKLTPKYDDKGTLHYQDPPYVPKTRTSSHQYTFELTHDQHRELAEINHSLKGFVVISGYPSELYAELYEAHGWPRFETEVNVNNGKLNRENASKRTEALWLNPNAFKALQAEKVQSSLFLEVA